jgi:glucose-1-phosphate cytidylyltransferase
MKCVLLCGGRGTRLSDETILKPKPMVEVGGKPLLWHVMKHYSYFGFNEFILALGYKGNVIRDYFLNYRDYNSDVLLDLNTNKRGYLTYTPEQYAWNVTLVDTGLDTQTGGRVKRLQKYIGNERFLCTYGDGLANVDINELIKYHDESPQHNLATLTAVLSKSKFGEIEFDKLGSVTSFEEKSKDSWINGGFFVMEPEIFEYINGDDDPLETGLLATLSRSNMLGAYPHTKFWQCVDNLKELEYVNKLWKGGNPPWVI